MGELVDYAEKNNLGLEEMIKRLKIELELIGAKIKYQNIQFDDLERDREEKRGSKL